MTDRKSKRKLPEEEGIKNEEENKKLTRPKDDAGDFKEEDVVVNKSNDDSDEIDEEFLDEEQDYENKEEDEGDEENDGDEDDDSDQELINKEIQVDFAAYDADEDDYDGIKCLLQRLWLKENIDLNELANVLIDENTIASVIKQETEEDDSEKNDDEEDDDDRYNVYAVVSLIPFNAHFTSKECIRQIKNFFLTRIPKDNEIYRKLESSDSVCSLMINERFLNLPPKISAPCYKQLVADLKQYIPTDGVTNSYEFEWVLMMCKVLKEKKEESKVTIYVNAEEEVFDEVATASFEYSVADQCDPVVFDWHDDEDENPYEPFRKLLLLKKKDWIQTIEGLKNVI